MGQMQCRQCNGNAVCWSFLTCVVLSYKRGFAVLYALTYYSQNMDSVYVLSDS